MNNFENFVCSPGGLLACAETKTFHIADAILLATPLLCDWR